MKLSEAMRIGASWNKKAIGHLKTNDGSTCAMGAAIEGAGFPLVQGQGGLHWHISMETLFPYLKTSVAMPCGCLPPTCKLWGVIVHLNNSHPMTRDEIADWIEKLEIENGWTGSDSPKEKIIEKDTKQLQEA